MLKQSLPGARIVVISGDSTAAVIREAVDGGAVGFVPKESTPALLIDAITVTAHGGIYLPRSVLGPALGPPPFKAPLHDGNMPTIRQAYPSLTKRQSEVLEFMVRGMPNKQIASTLNISGGTVKQHLNAVFRALGVENRTGAVYLLAKRGVRFA
jgi:DNA-binding NarL/FixJ family response regulator